MIKCTNPNKRALDAIIVFVLHLIAGIIFISTVVGVLVGILVIVYGMIIARLISCLGEIEANTKSTKELLEYSANQNKELNENIVKCGQYICDRLADICDSSISLKIGDSNGAGPVSAQDEP